MKRTRERRTAGLASAILAGMVTTGIAAEAWRLYWNPNPDEPGPTNGPTAGYLVRWSAESRTSAAFRGRTGMIRIEGRGATSSPVFSNVSGVIFVDVAAYGPAGNEGPPSVEVTIPPIGPISTNLLSPVAIRVIP